MKTTEIFVEQLIIGSLVLVIGAAMISNQFVAEVFKIDTGKAIALVATAYLVGILYDRFADTLLRDLERHHRLLFGLSPDRPASRRRSQDGKLDVFPENEYRIRLLKSDNGSDQAHYLRIRMRLTRALATLAPAASVAAIMALSPAIKLSSVAEWAQNGWRIAGACIVVIPYLLAFAMILRRDRWPPQKDAPETVLRKYRPPKTNVKLSEIRNYKNSIGLRPGYDGPPGGLLRFVLKQEPTFCALLLPVMLFALALAGAQSELAPFLLALGGAVLTILFGWGWWRISQTFYQFLDDYDRLGDVAGEPKVAPKSASTEPSEPKLSEASGIARKGNSLLIVSDGDHGAIHQLPMEGVVGPIIQIPPNRPTRLAMPGGALAIDLESVDVLADGRTVALSERLRALVDENGDLVVEYGDPLTEFADRGLEGLAVDRRKAGRSRVAVLWEGGYPSRGDTPAQLANKAGWNALWPVVFIHDIGPGVNGTKVKMKDGKILNLSVPRPEADDEPESKRFRAPDLVWHKWGRGRNKGEGFIVLLNSQNSPKNLSKDPDFGPRRLQRFDLLGRPVGEAIDLDNRAREITQSQKLNGANWEGLGWCEEGKSLLVIHDKSKKMPERRLTILVLPLPPTWQ